jgi:hypothetical protein
MQLATLGIAEASMSWRPTSSLAATPLSHLPILHVGLHKTATSWFQASVYPQAASHRLLNRIAPRRAMLGGTAFEFDAGAARAELDLDARLPAILCDEDLSGFLHNGGLASGYVAKVIAERLRDVVGPAEVVIFVREQAALAAAHCQQYLREGGTVGVRRYLLPEAYLDSDAGAARAAPSPSLRVRGPIALIGLNSAVPTAPHLATGRVGAAQLAPLADLLADLGARKLCRVVLVHHPPTHAGVSWRRRLEDGPELCAILARAGAELVLHGHSHRAARDTIASKHGLIPVCGVPATSSAVRSRPGAYQVFAIEQRASGFAIQCEVREIDAAARALRSRAPERLGAVE